VTDPLRLSFEVACPPEHAFEVWTSDIDTWWPTDHTVTGHTDLTVVLQPGVGGRIYERTFDGTEHDWGEITVWDPPARLAYRWHLRQAEADATEVVINFVAQGEDATRVDIEHRGWERLGLAGQQRRQTNRNGWESVLPHFVAAVEKGEGR
jgi:uncharacterized protein YndB with AHSA1/START domain